MTDELYRRRVDAPTVSLNAKLRESGVLGFAEVTYIRAPDAEDNATLGEMLRRLPQEWRVCHGYASTHGAPWCVMNDDATVVALGDTPDEALRQALTASGKDKGDANG